MSSPPEPSGPEPGDDEVDLLQQTTSGKYRAQTSRLVSWLVAPKRVSPGPSELPEGFFRSQEVADLPTGEAPPRKKRRLNDVVLPTGIDSRHYSFALSRDNQLFIYHEQNRRLALAKKYKLDLTTQSFSPRSGLAVWKGIEKVMAIEKRLRNSLIPEAEQRQILAYLQARQSLGSELQYMTDLWEDVDTYLAKRLVGETTRPYGFDVEYVKAVSEWSRLYVSFAFVRDMLACNPAAVAMFLATKPSKIDETAVRDKRTGLKYLRAEIRRLSNCDMNGNPVRLAKRLLNDIRTFAPNDDEAVASTQETISAFMDKYLPDLPPIVIGLAPAKSDEEWASILKDGAELVATRTGSVMPPLSLEYLKGTLQFVTPATWKKPSEAVFNSPEASQLRVTLLQEPRQ